MKYDIVVAGASFAGLAVASNFSGKILLIDRKDIGTLTTSACAAPLSSLEFMGCDDLALSVVSKVNFCTRYGSTRFRTIEPFATFNYKDVCTRLFSRFKGEFIKANILGFDGKHLLTDKGSFEGRIFVDCTGWRAKLASFLDERFVNYKELGFGIETELAFDVEEELYFLFDPKLIKPGYAWVFPAGNKARFGIGGYTYVEGLSEKLTSFLERYGLKPGKFHGGYMPYRLRSPVCGNLFLVGDSAGQIMPVTGEGIRQAFYFGHAARKVIGQIIAGEITLEEGLRVYEKFVAAHQGAYNLFLKIQYLWSKGPNLLIEIAARVFSRESLCKWAQRQFFDYFNFKSIEEKLEKVARS